MKIISTTADLQEYCDFAKDFDYITVDTEFLRQTTYYSQLCLVQLAVASNTEDAAVLVDPMADGISLLPLYDLFENKKVVKVFHAARQDIEIFWHDAQIIPTPLFDTQVAAMVCGFGEQVGYATLVDKIAKAEIDKSSRFTDWSRRPLSKEQQKYAIGDVTHLRQVYEFLAEKLQETGRSAWVEEELSTLTTPSTYEVIPEEAWKKIRTRTASRRFLANVKELARFREQYAQENDVPRSRVYKDEAISELAASRPKTIKELHKSRLLFREARKKDISEGILAAIARVENMDPNEYPIVKKEKNKPAKNPALADLLRVLLKAKADEFDVAQKMIANVSELDDLAAGIRECDALHGWRYEVFGKDALRLCDGSVGIAVKGQKICLLEL